jgi:hypothetical protein
MQPDRCLPIPERELQSPSPGKPCPQLLRKLILQLVLAFFLPTNLKPLLKKKQQHKNYLRK